MKAFPLHPERQRDFADLLRELNAHQVRYAVVGAYAVMAHSKSVRATKDIDVYASALSENLAALARALQAFGAPTNLCSVDALVPQPGQKFSGVTFGLPPRRVDVLTKMEVAFEELEPRIEQFDLLSEAIPVASVEDVIALKRLALKDDPKRKSDKADLKLLEALLPRARSRRR